MGIFFGVHKGVKRVKLGISGVNGVFFGSMGYARGQIRNYAGIIGDLLEIRG